MPPGRGSHSTKSNVVLLEINGAIGSNSVNGEMHYMASTFNVLFHSITSSIRSKSITITTRNLCFYFATNFDSTSNEFHGVGFFSNVGSFCLLMIAMVALIAA